MGLAHPVPRFGRAAGISVWIRSKLAESPPSPSSRKKARSATPRCAKRSGAGDNLKHVLIAFFGIMCAQGAVWYFAFFYVQVFLTRSLGVPGATKDLLVWP